MKDTGVLQVFIMVYGQENLWQGTGSQSNYWDASQKLVDPA